MENRLKRMKVYFILTALFLDLIFIGALYLFFNQVRFKASSLVYIVLVLLSLLYILILFGLKFDTKTRNPLLLKKFYFVASLFLLFYLPKIIFISFFIINKLIIFLQKGIFLLINLFTSKSLTAYNLSFVSYTGIAFASLLFLFLLYGMVAGRFNYKVEKVDLAFRNLPDKFNNFRLVQLSDIHLGTLPDKKKKVEKAIEIINSHKPDLILFTGDLVNNYSDEAIGWSDVFLKLKSKYKKYSVLGNHDYGDYWDWKTENDKELNMKLLMKIQEEMGFSLLLNESETIAIDGQEIGITGVENWGKPPFHQRGDINMALNNSKPVPFRILLSHDPSYWTHVIKNIDSVDLTLSGHTHGMQFGFKIGKFQWSPVKYIYECWSGLYENNGKYLYVNRGLGHIGYLGRAGMRPEITIITLKKLNHSLN